MLAATIAVGIRAIRVSTLLPTFAFLIAKYVIVMYIRRLHILPRRYITGNGSLSILPMLIPTDDAR